MLLGLGSAQAVILYSTGNSTNNTTAPSGTLANSGWQYEGFWGSFLGTPIAPKYFITAEHVGGAIGQTFVFREVSYATTAQFDDPDSDLRIWRICGTFPDFAPIYTQTNEVGQGLVVIGRGTQRGAAVTTTNVLGIVKTNGWKWGAYDGVTRWGENLVTAIVDGNSVFGSGLGQLLQAEFNANGGINECHLSFGDSSGAVFIKDGSTWKLAGINYAVDGPYNTTSTDPGFDAAVFDGSGLYEKNLAGLWLPANGPGSFYATRISAHVSWINSIINGVAPSDGAPTLQSSPGAAGPYQDEASAVVDDTAKSIRIALPASSQFYRLRACSPLTIESTQVQGGVLVLRYQ